MKDIYPKEKTAVTPLAHDWPLIIIMAVVLAALVTGIVVWILTQTVAAKIVSERATEIETLQGQVAQLQRDTAETDATEQTVTVAAAAESDTEEVAPAEEPAPATNTPPPNPATWVCGAWTADVVCYNHPIECKPGKWADIDNTIPWDGVSTKYYENAMGVVDDSWPGWRICEYREEYTDCHLENRLNNCVGTDDYMHSCYQTCTICNSGQYVNCGI